MKKILFLDDDPKRADKFLKENPCAKWVIDADECIAAFSETWDFVYLDHDLDGRVYVDPSEHNTGSGVVRYIISHQDKIPKTTSFIIHSFNDKEAIKMVKLLREAEYPAVYQPFGSVSTKDRDMFIDAVCDSDNFTLPGAIIINLDK
jgi:hypothetical protein